MRLCVVEAAAALVEGRMSRSPLAIPRCTVALRRTAGPLFRIASALLLTGLAACVPLTIYKTQVPPPGDTAQCGIAHPAIAGVQPCLEQATERTPFYTLHIVEFDDEGWPYAPARDSLSQLDSAIDQLKEQLKSSSDCVRLFVYVHGWRHNAGPADSNLSSFREFLRKVDAASKQSAATLIDACEDPILATAGQVALSPRSTRDVAPKSPVANAQVKTVGIFVGWRGLSIDDVEPIVYLSFWDRKKTAERVSQGSVRELFGRLSSLAQFAPAVPSRRSFKTGSNARLRTYVLAHSFGASVAFRALSQSLIDSFAEDLESDESAELASVSRFVDMVVLVNPAIEAARFDPVFRAAQKRVAYCVRNAKPGNRCDQPLYQAPVLGIFTSEGDKATKVAFPLGASLSTAFETTVNESQRRAIIQTIGWDDDYTTHALRAGTACTTADASPASDDGLGNLRYRQAGWVWCFRDDQSPPLSLTHDAKSSYNGPLWNVRVSKDVIRDHTDIWNPVFTSVLLQLFADQRSHPTPLVGPPWQPGDQ